MKTFFKSLRRQDGFTLVELMVVVAIIGLLSAVAIPNFKKYQAKSKMSEGKLHLSSIYTAETAFFSDFNIYSTCLVYMGYDPSLEISNRYYATGFGAGNNIDATTYSSAVNSGLMSNDCPATFASAPGGTLAAASQNSANFFSAGKGIGSSMATLIGYLPTTVLGTQDTSANMTFTAGAAGIISENFVTNANCSAMTITQAKVLQVTRNGY